jgi:homoserine dehydrogenase
MPNPLKIGLFGFGTVGESLYHLLKGHEHPPAEVRHICVKDPHKTRSLPADQFTYHREDVLNDDSLQLIVEVIDDPDEAFAICCQAMEKGFDVVSANKKMIAHRLGELLATQKKTGRHMLYDAAVCGSIPILRNVEEYYAMDNPHMISGILNGSCNYILTQMTRDPQNGGYSGILKEAQDKGFAESNPSLDVEGYDALYKLIILAAHSYGVVADPDQVLRFGIETVGSVDLAFAQARNKRLKLIGQAERLEKKLGLFVLPKMVNISDRLYHVDDEYNGVSVEAAAAGTHFYYGRGAGGNPTAYAVLADIHSMSKGYHYGLRKIRRANGLQLSEDLPVTAYLRLPLGSALSLPVFEGEVEEESRSGYRLLQGRILLSELHGFVRALPAQTPDVMIAVAD